MTALAIDTNAYTAFARGQPAAVEVFSMVDHLVVPVIVLGELRAGFALGSRTVANERDLTRFLGSPRVTIQNVDERVSTVYAAIFRQLRLAGRPVPSNDLWIAASALISGGVLFTFDAHFSAIEGLQAVNRWSQVSH